MRLRDKIRGWLGFPEPIQTKTAPRARGPLTHVIVLDGTMSTLESGMETNAGLTYRLLAEVAGEHRLSLRYEQGVQWRGWRYARDVIEGRGINRSIRRCYGFIASRYRPGDRIFLLGYSRGAFAVRSLAGVIDQMGLLKSQHATERNIRDVYRHYQLDPEGRSARVFARRYCHKDTPIEMVGCWDTVKALGLRLPVLWRLTEGQHDFHNHQLGHCVKAGYHALALHETREAYTPVLWDSEAGWDGILEQVWFRGTHGDIGGHLSGFDPARPLSNIPLVWMLDKAEGHGLPLPQGWRERFPMDPNAPSVGSMRGWGKLFLLRRKRKIGLDPSERIWSAVWKEAGREKPVLEEADEPLAATGTR